MRSTHVRPFARRGPAGLLVALLLLAVAGCSSDEPLPFCSFCEDWVQISPGLGRFPEPHPSNPDFLVYSTIDKMPGAVDSDREADEDLWLTIVQDRDDILANPKWQLTDDTLGFGDNFSPRWSPSGTQIAFVHTAGGGMFEVWRMPIALPATADSAVVAGPAERVVKDARDPAWADETRILFTRDDNLYAVDLPVGPGPPTASPVQLSFDPPSFVSTEDYVDRHPSFSPDLEGVFDTVDRQNVADIFIEAFEIDDTVFPPDTAATSAWILFQSPDATQAAYPIFQGPDTLKTPTLLQSIPVGAGGNFRIGVSRESRFLADSLAQSYCDTTLATVVRLQSGDVDSLRFYFKTVRGTLILQSTLPSTGVFWTRQDARETIHDFLSNTVLGTPGSRMVFDCLMPFAVGAGGAINAAVQETLLIVGTRGSLVDSVKTVVFPGDSTVVELFPSGTISGDLAFSNSPPVPPIVAIDIFLAGTTEQLPPASSDSTGQFLAALPEGSYDLVFRAEGYFDTRVDAIPVLPPGDTSIGTVTMADSTAGPAGREAPGVLAAGRLRQTAPRAAPGRATVTRRARRVAPRGGSPASLVSLLRAGDDLSTVWRIAPRPPEVDVETPLLVELFGSPGQIQHPALTKEFAGRVRYVAYISDENGIWELYVQRLVDWVPTGDPYHVVSPGTIDNLFCTRNIFHPRWRPDSSPGNLRLVVTMSDCPNNGFEELGFDDDPWAVGEIRLWEVTIPADAPL